MATSKNQKNTPVEPQDHLPAADDVLEIETAAGLVRIRPFRVTLGMFRRNKNLSEQELILNLIERHTLGPKDLDTLDELDMTDRGEDGNEFQDFVQEWQRRSGVNVGESSRSVG